MSTRARYGVRAMLDLAMNGEKSPVSVRDIARRQGVSARYLEHLLLALKKKGLVASRAGVRGGFLLARRPAAVRIRQIVEALEGSLAPVACLAESRICRRAPGCAARRLWLRVQAQIVRTLDRITLADLARMQAEEAGRHRHL